MKLSLRSKLSLSLCSIAVMLMVSSAISVMEYRSMSTYVSSLIADDISSIGEAQKLSDIASKYNLQLLSVIGEESSASVPEFDERHFMARCDVLKSSLESNVIAPLTDSVMYAYSAYMLTSLELQNVLESDYVDSRTWYFERLQPRYDRLVGDIGKLEDAIYSDLEANSKTFDRGFYRSVVPGIVAVGVCLLLVLMLLFFMMVYYVNPLYRMLKGLKDYRSMGKSYNCRFDGDDQLSELNTGITELTEENKTLLVRLKELKNAGK